VSSFGIGGTNAHVILEEAPPPPPSTPAGRPFHALLLSARTAEALDHATARLAAHLRRSSPPLADAAYTLQVGRRAFAHRRFVVCRSADEAAAALEGAAGPLDRDVARTPAPPVVFMFPGGGAQWVGMGRDLYRTEDAFRSEVDRAADALRGAVGADLRDTFFRGEPALGIDVERPTLAFPALFVVEYALARLWMRWGVRPAAMIGHSLGEYAAACLAGVMSLDDALSLVALRGKLFERTAEGAMLGVRLPEAELLPMLGAQLSLAASNGPDRCVVSGPSAAIADLEAALARRGSDTQRLHLGAAGHSSLLDPILDEFGDHVAKLALSPPSIPYLSNLTGTWIRDDEATSPRYWVRHMRHTVRFGAGIAELSRDPGRVLLEVGPGSTLSSLARAIAAGDAGRASAIIHSLPHAKDPTPELAALLQAAGRLWSRGVALDSAALHANSPRRRVPLPGYPFEAEWQRYWIMPPTARRRELSAPASELSVPSWKRTPWLNRSRIAACAGERWLVLGAGDGLGSRLVRRLEELGAECIAVVPGSRFEPAGERRYALRPGYLQDFTALVAALRERSALPIRAIDVALADRRADSPGAAAGRLAEGDFASALTFVRALSIEAPTASLKLVVVASESADVTGSDAVREGAAALSGAYAALREELPHLDCAVIDVEPPEPGSAEEAAIADRLIVEAQRETLSSEGRIAYRGPRRWAEILEPVSADPRPFAPDRACVVTGDLGALGLRVVESLSHALGRGGEVVLGGSPALPPRSQWGAWRSSGSGAGAPIPPLERTLEVDLEAEHSDLLEAYARIDAGLELDRPEDHPGLDEAMNRLCAAHVVDYLARCGVETHPGAVHDKQRLSERLGILPKFDKFYRALLATLRTTGIAADEGVQLRFAQPIEPAGALHAAMTRRFPRFESTFALLARCVRHYPEALSGRMDPHAVLYPEGRHDMLAEHAPVLTNDPACQALVIEAVARLAQRSAGLRVLEVGGGTGILTWPLAEALRGAGVSYTFTDIGRSFVVDARKQAARKGHDFLEARALDISRDPYAQGLPPHGFDVVLAYNVIHATPDVRASVRNLRSLMAPGAMLFQVQTVHNRHDTNMIFGLAEGWWYFDDAPLRTEGPFIEAPAWLDVLRAEGFRAAHAYPHRASAQKAVLVAQQPADPRAPCFQEHLARRQGEAARALGEAIGRLEALEQQTGVTLRVVSDPSREPDPARWRASAGLDGAQAVIHVVEPLPPVPIPELTGRKVEHLVRDRLEPLRRVRAAFEGAPIDVGLIVSASRSADVSQARAVDFALDRILDATVRAWRAEGAGTPWAGLALPDLDAARGGAILRRAASAAEDEPRFIARGRSAAPSETLPARAEAGEASPERDAAYTPPRSEDEARVAAIFREVLGVTRVGAFDNFFELGGDSLVALQVTARLQRACGVDIPVERLFARPTVAGLAELIAEQRTSAGAPPPVEAGRAIAPAARGQLDLSALLEKLDSLSEAEVERLLAGEPDGPGEAQGGTS
jgi:acyl transferase domain-containing protein/acyl carrier protein